MQKKKKKNYSKYKPKKLFIEGYDYADWYENVESSDKQEYVHISNMPPLEGDKE